ncbi:MAG: fibronectin type III domain-containing protein [Actinomycetota bacterium]|nr:fibronectin type III domain-containing protein [Actinomycetota bacterium]
MLPRDGAVTFTVDSTTADCVVASAFSDANGNDRLDLNRDNTPVSAFGVGGELLYRPAQAGAGAFAVTVAFVDKDANLFVSSGGSARTFRFDRSDRFLVRGSRSSFAEFSSRVSPGDTVAVAYAPDRDDASTFSLDDAAPTAPSDVRASTSGDDVTVDWAASSTGGVDAYRILRAPTATTCGETALGDEAEGAYAVVGQVDGQTTRFVDDDLGAGRYCYRVRALDEGDESPTSDESSVATVTGPTDTTR